MNIAAGSPPISRRPLYCLRTCRLLLIVILFLHTATEAFLALTYPTRSGGVVRQRWAEKEVTYVIDRTGSDDMPAATSAAILRESFAVWSDVDGSSLRLIDGGTTNDIAPVSTDGRNLVIFDETGAWLNPPPGTGVIAVTRLESNFDGTITDADIIFNGRDFTFTNGVSGTAINLKDVAVHEVGHLIGLDHTPLQGSAATRPTMNPFYTGDGPGEASSLEPDDEAGISYLYPVPSHSLATGIIAGSVVDDGGVGVFGAHVLAENTSTGQVFSTLSGAYPDQGDPGSYFLFGLTPGSYRLQLAAVGGGITARNFAGIFEDFATGFPLEHYDNAALSSHAVLVDVQSGQQTGGIDFVTGFELVEGAIAPIALPNSTPDPTGPYRVEVIAAQAKAVSLAYRIEHTGGASGTQTLPMYLTLDESVYATDIPGQPAASRVLYRISATNDDGTEVTFPSSEDQWLRFDVLSLSGSQLAFTVLRDEDAVGVFDTGSERELARIPVGSDPIQILGSSDGHRLFVSNLASNDITVLETSTFQTSARIDVSEDPLDLAQAPDGSVVYITNSDAASLTTIDVETLQSREIAIPGLEEGPYGVAATSERIFVSDIGAHEIIALDLQGNVVTRSEGPDSPRSLAVSPDGGTLYSTSFTTPQLAAFDTQTLQLTGLLDLPLTGSFALGASPDGRKLYVTGHLDNTVIVVDALELEVLTSIAIGDNPRGVTFSPDGATVMVTSAESNQIHHVDAASDTIIGAYEVNGQPRGIAIVDPPSFGEEDLPTAVKEPPLPNLFSLSQPFPNPFNSTIQVRFSIPDQMVGEGSSVVIYDALGQPVRTLVNGPLEPGQYHLTWDGLNDEANRVAAGAYLMLLRAGGESASAKIMYLK